jgi:hypothetical protein
VVVVVVDDEDGAAFGEAVFAEIESYMDDVDGCAFFK